MAVQKVTIETIHQAKLARDKIGNKNLPDWRLRDSEYVNMVVAFKRDRVFVSSKNTAKIGYKGSQTSVFFKTDIHLFGFSDEKRIDLNVLEGAYIQVQSSKRETQLFQVIKGNLHDISVSDFYAGSTAGTPPDPVPVTQLFEQVQA